jgi:hypothetical protein
MKRSIEDALEDAQAEAAVDALARRARGEAIDAELAFDDAELQQMERLQPAADPALEAERLASFRAAVQPAPVTPLRRKSPRTGVVVGGALAAAASLAILLTQPFPLLTAPTLTQLSPGATKLAGAGEPAAIVRTVPEGGCLNLAIALKNAGPLSDSVLAEAYLEQGSQRLPWPVSTTLKEGALHASGCIPLPAAAQAGTWNLVMLVGYPGLLKLFGPAALEHRSETQWTPYRGIWIAREPLTITHSP